jgi:LysM repeat protein
MKNILTLVLSIFFLQNIGAQNQLFFYAKADCSNRMEYRYNAQSNSPGIVTYSMRQSPNQLYLFDMGAEGNTIFKALPKGTVSCSEAKLNEEIVRSINNGTRKAYILRDVQGGFLVSPVAQATQVVNTGAVYTVKSHNFDFTIDTEHLTTGENLAQKGSSSYIFYNGMYYSDCHSVYSFRREPDEACATRTDFDLIPNLGIISERTGTTTANALENEYSLHKINGFSSLDYLLSMCKGTIPKQQVATVPETPNNTTEYILPIQYNQVAIEQDKENASMSVAPAQTPVTYAKPTFVGPRLVDCPEKPGEGYHIVQPGETLNAIARAYRLKVGAIISWNGLKDPDLLQTCQKVYITAPPGGVKTGIDQKTGNLVIADKPGKKSKTKGKTKKSVAPAPVTYSTEAVVAKNTIKGEVTPQYAHWENPNASKEEVRIQYVPQYIYVQVPADQKTEQPVQQIYQPEKPIQYASQTSQIPKEAKQLSAGTGILHTVQAGESIYSISRLYGFMPERFRKMNGLPENFVLQPGMKLTTTDCSCEAPRNFVTGDENPNITKSTSNKGGTFEEVDVVKPLEFSTNNTTVPTKLISTRSGRFVEHVVREGETLGSISKRYNTTTDDILNTNDIEATETLIAGMRLMIPR